MLKPAEAAGAAAQTAPRAAKPLARRYLMMGYYVMKTLLSLIRALARVAHVLRLMARHIAIATNRRATLIRSALTIGAILFTGVANGSSIDAFLEAYPAASAKLAAVYGQVRISATRTVFDRSGKPTDLEEVENSREDDAVRQVVTRLQSRKPDAAAVVARGGDSRKYFMIDKQRADSPFVIESFGPRADFEDAAHRNCPLASAPYCVLNRRVVDYIRRPGVRVLAVTPTHIEGAEVTDVATDERIQNGKRQLSDFLFDGRTWALRGWSVAIRGDNPAHDTFMRCAIAYVGDAPPKIKRYEYWVGLEAQPNIKASHEVYDVSKLEFGPIPREQFTLAAFDVEEPVLTRGGPGFIWFLVINSVLFVLLGIVFRVLYVRRRRRTA
jgi:hypothetical protein